MDDTHTPPYDDAPAYVAGLLRRAAAAGLTDLYLLPGADGDEALRGRATDERGGHAVSPRAHGLRDDRPLPDIDAAEPDGGAGVGGDGDDALGESLLERGDLHLRGLLVRWRGRHADVKRIQPPHGSKRR